jgi:hypothetical protein
VRISPPPLPPSSGKNAPLRHLSPFLPPSLTSFFPQQTRLASNTANTSVPLLLSEIATSLCVLPGSTRNLQPFTP